MFERNEIKRMTDIFKKRFSFSLKVYELTAEGLKETNFKVDASKYFFVKVGANFDLSLKVYADVFNDEQGTDLNTSLFHNEATGDLITFYYRENKKYLYAFTARKLENASS